MLAKNLYPFKGTPGHKDVVLCGTIPLGTSGALATTYAKNTHSKGVTVTRSGTGEYTLTLDGPVNVLRSWSAGVVGAYGAGGYVPVMTSSSPSTGVFVISWVKGNTDSVTEIANNLSWSFTLIVGTSSVT
jgi:hypothetical protein